MRFRKSLYILFPIIIFSAESVEEILQHLKTDGSEWALELRLFNVCQHACELFSNNY